MSMERESVERSAAKNGSNKQKCKTRVIGVPFPPVKIQTPLAEYPSGGLVNKANFFIFFSKIPIFVMAGGGGVQLICVINAYSFFLSFFLSLFNSLLEEDVERAEEEESKVYFLFFSPAMNRIEPGDFSSYFIIIMDLHRSIE